MKLKSLSQELKTTLSLALPLIVALLAQKGLQVINTIMMGLLGPDDLAAAALATSVFAMLVVIGIGLLSVTGVLISEAIGRDDQNHHEVNHILHQGLYSSLLLSLPCMIIIWFVPKLFYLLKQPVAVIPLATDYLRTTMWGFPALLGFFSLREYVSAFHFPRLVVWVCILALPFNALISYCLMFGKLGLPVLQIKGIGYANALTEWAMFFGLLIYIQNHPFLRGISNFLQFSAPSKKTILRIFRLGFPVGISYFLDLFMFGLLTLMMGYFGVYALAAHQIATQCISFVYMLPLGISFAMSLLVSKNLGAEKHQAVFYSIFSGLLLGCALTLSIVAIFVLYPEFIVKIFLHPDQTNYTLVEQLTISFLAVGSLFVIFDMLQGILSGCLRGFRDTFVPMAVAILSFLIIGLSLGYYLAFIRQLGGVGLWWGLAAGLCAHSIFLGIRLYFKIRRIKPDSYF